MVVSIQACRVEGSGGESRMEVLLLKGSQAAPGWTGREHHGVLGRKDSLIMVMTC